MQRTALLRRSPIKPKRKPAKSQMVKFHHDRVAALGCLVSGRPATLHHVTATIFGARITRDDRCVVPLAPEHHQKVFDPKASDPISVEGLGHQRFYLKYGLDLMSIGDSLWIESERLWEARNGA